MIASAPPWRTSGGLPDHDVLISAGAKAAILSALRAACRAGERVLIISPCWPSYPDIARLLFLRPVCFETRLEEGFAVDPAALAAAMAQSRATAIVFSNPATPPAESIPVRSSKRLPGSRASSERFC